MSSTPHSTLFYMVTAAAALLVDPASALFISDQHLHFSHQKLGRPSFARLNAYDNQSKYSELEKLKAKRLSIQRRRLSESDDVADSLISINKVAHQDQHASQSLESNGLEYLYEAREERHSDDLFHIILMPSSFRKDYVSVDYVAESCSEILGIRSDKAYDLSLYAKHQGFSTLGTWTREECLSMGKQLLSRNLDCRVIPFHMGALDVIASYGDKNFATRSSGEIDTLYLV